MWGEKRARVELFGGQEILNDGMINRMSENKNPYRKDFNK